MIWLWWLVYTRIVEDFHVVSWIFTWLLLFFSALNFNESRSVFLFSRNGLVLHLKTHVVKCRNILFVYLLYFRFSRHSGILYRLTCSFILSLLSKHRSHALRFSLHHLPSLWDGIFLIFPWIWVHRPLILWFFDSQHMTYLFLIFRLSQKFI